MSTATLYSLKDDKVFIPATNWFEERSIADLKETNQQYIISSLEERFKELEEKVNEIVKEYETIGEKVKLAGKVVRTKSYICTAKAIGDYSSILIPLDKIEAEIKMEVDKVLAQKEQLCQEAEALLQTTEWRESTDKLRELQKQFKELPSVPDLKNEQFRERFEKTKDDFFKNKQASFESFEQDLLDNLSKKIDLCEKAEALQNSTNWKKTTDLYQEMNEEWKKIGIVPKHRVEELWFRFSTAKDIFFNNKREHYGEVKSDQEQNLVKKLELIAKADALKESTDWKKTTDAYNLLMEEWKKIGRVPHEKNDETWDLFVAAKNHFYKNKDAHYGNQRVQLEDNYARKMSIVNHAEELQNSQEFESATKEFMDMFEEWKTIGRTPKEYSDDAWERFMKAKKNFFDRKDASREKRKIELTKDIRERVERNRSNYNRYSRDIQREEDLLFDIEERMANLPHTLRSYEKREEYKELMEELKVKINELKGKAKEVKERMNQDDRELNYIMRGPRKKENEKPAPAKTSEKKIEKEKPNVEMQAPVIAASANESSAEISDSKAAELPVEIKEDMVVENVETTAAVVEESTELPAATAETPTAIVEEETNILPEVIIENTIVENVEPTAAAAIEVVTELPASIVETPTDEPQTDENTTPEIAG